MSALVLQGAPIRILSRRPLPGLRRYSNAMEDEPPKPDFQRGRQNFILSTLNPELLKSGDAVDPSGKTHLALRFSGGRSPLSYTANHQGIPFPAFSRGFLYYHSHSWRIPLEASLRFRVTLDNNPSSFARGRDLLTPWGLPWKIMLPQIACTARYAPIREQLLRDNLTTEELLSHCRTIFGERPISTRYTLFRFDSTFPVNFATRKMKLAIVGEALYPVAIGTGFSGFPWTGSALARFEPSGRIQDASRRVIHLRIVKVLQPLVCTVEEYKGRMLAVEEGELLAVSNYRRTPEPWEYDIDSGTGKHAAALRVLWDNSKLPSALARVFS
ncbi:hypothetical protein C8R44DRAFT_849945 [Mycena epipterygia]|nr:hypothetical protein C8R44DRAFT_849945 [Mycena epipterygia]